MAQSLVGRPTVVGSLASLLLASSCSLTGPLDGYAEGDPPQGVDAGQDVSVDSEPEAQVEAGACPAGFADCDGDESNGCEVQVATDPEHCGACNQPCEVSNALPACEGGECRIGSCLDGYANCDEDDVTGCETDLASAAACGACGNACEFDHAEAICDTGACRMGACLDGYGDCDDSEDNGCEVSTDTSVEHCGSCSNACSERPNSSPSCEGGKCALVCDGGYADCDGDFANGCEAEVTTDALNCGGCDKVCSTNHATSECVAEVCQLVCDEDFDDCDGDVDTGCEADLLFSSDHCGGCGQGCPSPDGAVATCEAGVCGYACLAGLGDCNGQEADGCEMDLLTSALHCGECGRSCLGGECVGGRCSAEELVTGLNRPSGIVLDASRVYWTDSQDNSVYSVDKAGGAKATLAVGGATGPITISGAMLYWATGAAIDRITTGGANQQGVVGGESLVADLTNDGTNLYWLRTGTWSGSTYNNDGSVVRAAQTGGTAVSLTTNSQRRPTALAVDATHVYWVNEGTYTGLTYNKNGSVLRVGKTGGATMTIATGQDKPCGIAVNDSSVYWANCGSGVVMMADKGSTPQELLSGLSISEGLRLDGKELFWPYLGPNPNVATGEVRKASISSLAVLVLAAQQQQPFRVAVDSTHVYWLNHGAPPFGDGGLMRVAR